MGRPARRQNTPLCDAIPDDDDVLRAKIDAWFSFSNPVFTSPKDAKADLVESAFIVIKHRFGCLNPMGSWQEVIALDCT